MESPVHPHIEAFRKAFPIAVSVYQEIDHILYFNQKYRLEDTIKKAKDLIFKNGWNLEVNERYQAMEIKVISDLERMHNTFGTASEKLTDLQKALIVHDCI